MWLIHRRWRHFRSKQSREACMLSSMYRNLACVQGCCRLGADSQSRASVVRQIGRKDRYPYSISRACREHHDRGFQVSYLDFLAGWWAGWILNRESVVAIELRVGSHTYDKKSSSLAAESSTKLGSLTVWDTGEFEAEVLDFRTRSRTHVTSTIIKDEEDFAHHLARFVRACEST